MRASMKLKILRFAEVNLTMPLDGSGEQGRRVNEIELAYYAP